MDRAQALQTAPEEYRLGFTDGMCGGARSGRGPAYIVGYSDGFITERAQAQDKKPDRLFRCVNEPMVQIRRKEQPAKKKTYPLSYERVDEFTEAVMEAYAEAGVDQVVFKEERDHLMTLFSDFLSDVNEVREDLKARNAPRTYKGAGKNVSDLRTGQKSKENGSKI